MAVNSIQSFRANMMKMEDDLQKGYIEDKSEHYRFLASMLIDQGRLSEAQQALAMLKEEEYFDFIRRDIDQDDIRSTMVPFTATEERWHQEYLDLTAELLPIRKKLIDLMTKKKERELSPDEENRLETANEEFEVWGEGFKQFLMDVQIELGKANHTRSIETVNMNLDKLKILQGMLRDLGQDTVLIHYLITDKKLRIILTTAQSIQVRDAEITAKKLNQKIFTFRQALQDPSSTPQKKAEELYAVVMGPIAQDLKQNGAKTLMIYMDGVLRYLPYAALYDGKNYVAEDYRIAMFTEAAQTKLTYRPKENWHMVGMGVTREISGFSPLPAVKTELESIVKRDAKDPDGVVPGIIRIDDDFIMNTFADALHKDYPVLHIASHFVFKPGVESSSYLLLGDGSQLSLDMITEKNFDFKNVDLLTLSACETAMPGAGADGREIEGFGGLAQRQGAKAVLATLWPVADKGTGIFMKNMYQYHQEQKLTKIEALRKAQVEFIHSDKYSHPFFWAPFILMGNWL